MIAFIRRKNFIRLEFLCARQLERAGSVCAPVDKFLQTIYFTASLSFTFSLPQQLSWLQWQGSPFPSVIETKSGSSPTPKAGSTEGTTSGSLREERHTQDKSSCEAATCSEET